MFGKVHQFRNGVQVYDSHISDAQRGRYQRENVHEPQEEMVFQKLIKTIPPEGCFVNVGSAIGYYPILAKSLRPDIEVHAFEPLYEHREKCESNLILNGFSDEDVAIHNVAISSESGWLKFVDAGFGSRIVETDMRSVAGLLREAKFWSRYVLRLLGRQQRVEAQLVQSRTLWDVSQEIDGALHLVQLDVQGWEIDVLKGAERLLESEIIRGLLIGTHGRKIHRKCKIFLEQYNYEVLYDRPCPADQPDGILAAAVTGLMSRT